MATGLQNSFLGGLKTEFTGLNFPENSATDTQNCFYSLIGDVTRREGYDYEANYTTFSTNRTNSALSTYRWINAGGDGLTQVLVQQIDGVLYFYKSSSATTAAPLSTTKLASTVSLSNFVASGGTLDTTTECQYATGNGYLFVFHPSCDPIYCTYNAGTITGTAILINVRDTLGIIESGVASNTRPTVLTNEHEYNLQNQGWVNAPSWSTVGAGNWTINNGSQTFTVGTGLTISGGQAFSGYTFVVQAGVNAGFGGTVTSYNSGTGVIVLNVTYSSYDGLTGSGINIQSVNSSFITTWNSAVGNYPSNSDVWWQFKLPATNTAAAQFPTSTVLANQVASFTANAGQCPQGYYIFSAFNQNRGAVSGISSLTTVSTLVRPTTGTFFQGRVWYSGVNASFPSSGDQQFYNWSETIYFSQIVEHTADFGSCYMSNDPTSETLFDLLPSDGGTIVIPGAGAIYKLFPLKFGLLVLAANGIWYISGSTGSGFTANDYMVNRISAIQTVSGTSVVDVQGFPMFWNNEGIYYVTPSKTAGSEHSPDIALDVTNLCLGTILTYYQGIPLQSIKFARGDYHQLDYVVQWCFRSTNESTVTDRYQYDTILNYNIVTKAFYPYTPATGGSLPYIHDIKYIQSPGGTGAPLPIFKYVTSINTGVGAYSFTFSEERNTTYNDWVTVSSTNYTSYFKSGYSLAGKGYYKFYMPYLVMYSRNSAANEYMIQSIWDYAGTGNSGRWSVRQVITNNNSNFTSLYRRHRLRGHGRGAVQIFVSSMPGQPFDFIGWAIEDTIQGGS